MLGLDALSSTVGREFAMHAAAVGTLCTCSLPGRQDEVRVHPGGPGNPHGPDWQSLRERGCAVPVPLRDRNQRAALEVTPAVLDIDRPSACRAATTGRTVRELRAAR